MTTTLRSKKNKNLLAFSEHEHNIFKKKTSIKVIGKKMVPFFLCLLLYVPLSAVVVFCQYFSLSYFAMIIVLIYLYLVCFQND